MGSRKRLLAIAALLVVVGAVAAVVASYRRDVRAAFDKLVDSSDIAMTPCGPIEYASAGDGPPVLFVHGAGGGFDQGLAFGAGLVERGYRVIAMSRFGYLRTPLPEDASAAAQADAHACLLDALGIDRAAVAAGSAGAPSALQMAIRHPDRVTSLALIVPAAFVPRPGDAASLLTPADTPWLFDSALRSDFLFWAALRIAPDTMIRAILATPPEDVAGAEPSEQARVATILRAILPVSVRRLGLLNDAYVTSHLERYELERITAPTLVVSVADDLFGTYDAARYTAAQIPAARFVGYPSGGHVWVGRQQALMTELADFLGARPGR